MFVLSNNADMTFFLRNNADMTWLWSFWNDFHNGESHVSCLNLKQIMRITDGFSWRIEGIVHIRLTDGIACLLLHRYLESYSIACLLLHRFLKVAPQPSFWGLPANVWFTSSRTNGWSCSEETTSTRASSTWRNGRTEKRCWSDAGKVVLSVSILSLNLT